MRLKAHFVFVVLLELKLPWLLPLRANCALLDMPLKTVPPVILDNLGQVMTKTVQPATIVQKVGIKM